MLRRHFLTTLAAAPLLQARPNKIDRTRLSPIADEVSKTSMNDVYAFVEKFGLKNLELRDVPGEKIHFYKLPEDRLRTFAKEFKSRGINISFFNTPFLKYTLPGTDPKRSRPETAEAKQRRLARDQQMFNTRIEDLKQGIRAAHILGVDKLRIFTFSRVAEPESIYPRIAEVITEMAHVADKEKIHLLVENEGSQNTASSAELGKFIEHVHAKNVGLNWDTFNVPTEQERAFPEGYSYIPKKRMLNLQAKGKTLLLEKNKLDWNGLFRALEKDGYKGCVGLETHFLDGTDPEKSKLAMAEMIRLAENPT